MRIARRQALGVAAIDPTSAERHGRKAEQKVFERLRAALPAEYRLHPNVAWLGRTAAHRGLRDGEADLVIAHPDRGLLVIEVKGGRIARDARGTWLQNGRQLRVSPFQQAQTSRHQLLEKLSELPDAPARWDPIAGHAVAFPDVDLASVRVDPRFLGPDVDPALIFDRSLLASDAAPALREAIDRAFALWAGVGGSRTSPGERGIGLLDTILTTPIELRSLLRSEIDEGEREVVRLTRGQLTVLQNLQRVRRTEIRGGAGTGKTLLALAKARQLARQGFTTLLVCFNQPLARMLMAEVADLPERERPQVSTFHQLCEDLGRKAGTLPPKPDPPGQEWWNQDLPNALLEAIPALPDRYHAMVVDEGQDFERDWLTTLDLLLETPADDVFYVFHDPAQVLFREADSVASLGLQPQDVMMNCRNAQPIHRLVAGFAEGQLDTDALRMDGREPEIIEASTAAETIDALRRVLHRLRHDENVRPWEIAVLTGRRIEASDVWRQRTFGNEVLWNGNVDDAGRVLALRADEVPPVPDDAILFDSIRRFKGLERPIVILVELPEDDARLERLLYVGISRARQHVVLVVTTELAQRLRRVTP